MFVSTIHTYELLVMENYELLKLMDEEGDTDPSSHRNLIVGRLNSALYHLGGAIKLMDGRSDWPESLLTEVSRRGYKEERMTFMKEFKVRWELEWKESFDSEAEEPYRELAIETYIKYGNAFGISW